VKSEFSEIPLKFCNGRNNATEKLVCRCAGFYITQYFRVAIATIKTLTNHVMTVLLQVYVLSVPVAAAIAQSYYRMHITVAFAPSFWTLFNLF